MTKAVGGVLLIVIGMALFFVGQDVLIRALGLGFAVTGVLMLIVAMIGGDDGER